MKSGVLYDSKKKERQEVYVGRLIIFLKSSAQVLSVGGLMMIVISAMGLVVIYWPLAMAQAKYSTVSTLRSMKGAVVKYPATPTPTAGMPAPSTNPELTAFPSPTDIPFWVTKPVYNVPDENYSINIPKILAVSKVIPNVDAGNTQAYMEALRNGVAEASGLAHPGEVGTTYLFAHSVGSRVDFARYNAVFYLLHKLESGDQVEVVYQKRMYKYVVEETEILPPSDLKFLVPQKEREILVLQTCYPPGTTWKRLVVVAKRVS
ncbi:hypothetical protein A2972_02835 [Candidatus Amesbacteria bacterium RIFCSPLOWO2_01_FULL_47_33]|uniref:Secreted enzyme, sortase n=3 Tax=Candidatus Amesiibacteriota TaxID=1752730 RepID=A0A0G1S2V2_9BACT|nr:MAG: secreted enzyme, sortase [Candidatus Amesbacteria bacterium GW2011_GWC1_47_15]KKU95469.1 MAG: secreted enzyme, sortase [Candidatus Amesbacteria bacterium GW2011_GWB1_48_13]OGD00160.1 MAG: hypothetical protein A2972_02835 [Candidatus Amesbacteria bacterium RIFCSPLOWO2_01_FULL_47_33]